MKLPVAAITLSSALILSGTVMAAERTVVLAIDNMYCDACPGIVKKSLDKVTGVKNVVVSYEKKTARVTYDDNKATVAALTAATTNAGYPSRVTQ
jgi:mercuric ion binding protein